MLCSCSKVGDSGGGLLAHNIFSKYVSITAMQTKPHTPALHDIYSTTEQAKVQKCQITQTSNYFGTTDHEESKAIVQMSSILWVKVSYEGPAANGDVELRQPLQQVRLQSSAALRPLNEPGQHSTVPTPAATTWDTM